MNGVHGPQWSEININRPTGKKGTYDESRGSIDWVDMVVADLEKDTSANMSRERLAAPPPHF